LALSLNGLICADVPLKIYSLIHPTFKLQFSPPFAIHWNQKLRLYLIHNRSYHRLKICLIFPIGAIVFFKFYNKYVKYYILIF